MEYLLAHFPRTSPLHARLQSCTQCNERRGFRLAPVLYLIDASVFVWRAYHSVPIALVDPDGNPVNALHGFARFLGDLIERVRPVHIAVAFDAQLVDSFRARAVPRVQGESRPGAAGAETAVRPVPLHLRSARYQEFTSHEYEADDIVGTLATRMRAAGQNVTRRHARQGPGAARSARATSTGITSASGASATTRSRGRFGVQPGAHGVLPRARPATPSTTSPACPASAARPRRCCSDLRIARASLRRSRIACSSSSSCAIPGSSAASCATIASPRSSRAS